MADGWLLQDELDDLDNVEAVNRMRIERRRLRDRQDPFQLTEAHFCKIFRFTRQVVTTLIEELQPRLQRQRANGLSVQTQVLCALRFYAQGSYQLGVGLQAFISLSQASVSRCIHAVTRAIVDEYTRRVIVFPTNQRQRDEARAEFAAAPQPFVGAIGAIDCTHVKIPTPTEHEEAYLNHHGYHSLNVQLVCAPNLRILNVDSRFPGSRHDAAIWRASAVRRYMERWYQRGERETWLLGDSGYPLEPWLMTPITNAEEGTPEYRYTEDHCKARSPIERCNGVLKMVFRCLCEQRVLMYAPEFAGNIVLACAILHNMRLMHRMAEQEAEAAAAAEADDDDEDEEEEANPELPGAVAPAAAPVAVAAPPEEEPPGDGERLAIARLIRARIVHQRFAG